MSRILPLFYLPHHYHLSSGFHLLLIIPGLCHTKAQGYDGFMLNQSKGMFYTLPFYDFPKNKQ